MQKRAERKYKSDVIDRNPWKEPTSSTKKPAPTVPKMAANVPAVFEIPITTERTFVINSEIQSAFEYLMRRRKCDHMRSNIYKETDFIYRVKHQNIEEQSPVTETKE